jgi:hypothetical protein
MHINTIDLAYSKSQIFIGLTTFCWASNPSIKDLTLTFFRVGGLYSKRAVWQKVCAAVCEVAFRSFLVVPTPAPQTMHLTHHANSRSCEFTNSRRCNPMQCRLVNPSDHLFLPRYREPQMRFWVRERVSWSAGVWTRWNTPCFAHQSKQIWHLESSAPFRFGFYALPSPRPVNTCFPASLFAVCGTIWYHAYTMRVLGFTFLPSVRPLWSPSHPRGIYPIAHIAYCDPHNAGSVHGATLGAFPW